MNHSAVRVDATKCPRTPASRQTDAQFDFSRARRRRALARLANRLRGQPGATSRSCRSRRSSRRSAGRGERSLGLQSIELDSIVGTVDRAREFDRDFRPTSAPRAARWERIAEAQRRGETMPPISRLPDRRPALRARRPPPRVASPARSGPHDIDAYVTEVETQVGVDARLRLADLPLKSHERLFFERVPLPPEARERVRLSDPWDYARLAEGVEAWGFRRCRAAASS